MSLWYVAHLNTYLDLVSYLQDTKIRFNCKSNLTSAIGNFSESWHLASYVSCHNAMAYDTLQASTLSSNEVSIRVYSIIHQQALYRQHGTVPHQGPLWQPVCHDCLSCRWHFHPPATFKSRSNTHWIAAYNTIMMHLAAQGLSVNLQILDNKASAAYKHAITSTWQAKFQLLPLDMHCQNHAEQAIRTFKAHFFSTLAGVDLTFQPYLWDLLLPQAELTPNLLQQSALNHQISTWEYFQGPF
jgi:hypothetical protein